MQRSIASVDCSNDPLRIVLREFWSVYCSDHTDQHLCVVLTMVLQ